MLAGRTSTIAAKDIPRRVRPSGYTGLGLLEALALQPLTLQLTSTANGFGGFAGTTLGRLFKMPTQLHLAENTLPLHLLLERLERLIDVIVTHEDLHLAASSFRRCAPANREHEKMPRPGDTVAEGWGYTMAPESYKPNSRA